ncbi:MAG: hypothetical protein M1540_03355 [Candidatus Bathyarchaeota archaeon]|nr:hypothetical protein [Candidatus Bathyarchaeota archaeon]
MKRTIIKMEDSFFNSFISVKTVWFLPFIFILKTLVNVKRRKDRKCKLATFF